MKKILFFLSVLFACFAANAADDYSKTNYIEKYGTLKLNGLQLSDQNGNAIQLKGWSTFGLNYSEASGCMSQEAVNVMKGWGANIVRLAMYATGGWGKSASYYATKMKQYVDYAYEAGIYCIVDYHILPTNENGNNADPNNYLNGGSAIGGSSTGAENYFDVMTAYIKEKGYNHVIYEICNEPGQIGWSQIKKYANTVIPHILENDPDALIICGTPQWDQLPVQAAADPIKKVNNTDVSKQILYAFHYYSCTHYNFLSNLKSAAGKIPMFVSEWGVSDYTGGSNGEGFAYEDDICPSLGNSLLEVCDGANDGNAKLSWCFWNWSNKDEESSSLKECNNYTTAPSGTYIKEHLCGDGDCKTVIKTDGPFDGYQVIPTPSGEYFAVGKFDKGGEGVAYHDENSTKDDQAKCTASDCKSSNENQCYAGAQWCAYRNDQCVDVTSIAGTNLKLGNYPYGVEVPEWNEYNIGWREPGEWMAYSIDVKEAGYYKFGVADNGGVDPVSFSLKKADGTALGNALYNSGTEESVDAWYLPGIGYDENKLYGWWKPNDEDGNVDDNVSLLVREAGKYVLTITWSTANDGENGIGGGNVGPMHFYKAAAYSGKTYEELGIGTGTATEDTKVDAQNVVVYPNPAEDVLNVNVDAEKVEVLNLAGAVVASANTNSVQVANLAAGMYIVKVYTNNNVVVKQFIKK